MAGPSLYRRLLGARFDRLPTALRAFHDEPDGHRARGEFEVRRGNGWLASGIAWTLGMPRGGSGVPVELVVRVEGDRERWTRQIGGRTMETVQWARDGLLIEALGPWSFASDVFADESGLRFVFRRAWLGPIPWPIALGPRIEGEALAREPVGWTVDVRVQAPFVGLVLGYRGWVVPV